MAAGSTSHDTFGAVSTPVAIAGALRFSGWAADPDALTSNVLVAAVVDGHRTTPWTATSVASPIIRARYHTGPTPGFVVSTAIASGPHTVCIAAHNIGYGSTTLLTCHALPLGSTLTKAQVAVHNPRGAVTGAWPHAHSLHLRGWAYDPDYVSRHGLVLLYVDNRPVATVHTAEYLEPPTGVGPNALFDISVPVSSGAHVACLWAVNAGLGSNSWLGCRAMDTRGAPGTMPVVQPSLNKQVLAEAKTHIGQPYVWGASGPNTFDCSGLVAYSYHKFGFTPPRIAAAQFAAARNIPAARAVPGDLVFYSDTQGDVYHVGIVSGPGMSVAAIDQAEGVNWQRVWGASLTYYGSFTHT